MATLIIVLTLLVCLAFIAYKFKAIKVDILNQEVKKQNEAYQQETLELITERESKIVEVDKDINSHLSQLQQVIKQETAIVNSVLEQEKERVREGLSAYADILDSHYTDVEEEYDAKIAILQDNLDKMKATRDANIQALLREREIEEKENFFKISISNIDLEDITWLESIKPRLHHPEVLSKLIWSTYYQKEITALCNNILKINTVCGIYKITDITTKLAYIGQSVNIAQRWKDHVKTALGASNTTASNKLYKLMRENGIHNFTFELLEQVPSSQLNEKEKYYIDLYKSNIYGLNTTKGNL